MKRFVFLILSFFVFASVQAQQAPRPFIGTYSTSLTRPANPTTYTAGDVVNSGTAAAHSYTADWSRGAIVGVRMTVDTLNVANGTFRLFLFKDTTGVGVLTDNAAFAPTRAILANVIAVADLTLIATGTATATGVYAVNANFRNHFAGVTRIYGILTATGAWVPKFSGVIGLSITIAPD